MQMLITVTSAGGPQRPARTVGTDIVDQLRQSPDVAEVTSAWTAAARRPRALISNDGKTGLIVAGITGGERASAEARQDMSERFVHDRDGVTVRAGGEAMVYAQINNQCEHDLLLMESIAVPLSFVVLVWVFGGLLAAALPLAVGLRAILGSMAVMRAITYRHRRVDLRAEPDHCDGPGAGHRLHVVDCQPLPRRVGQRRRPRRGADPHMTTAGRTVLFSATTVALSMAAMVLFPMYFLNRSPTPVSPPSPSPRWPRLW